MKRAQYLRLATILLVSIITAVFAATPAGTIISNQAAALVEGETYYSNVVETVVLPICSVSVSPDGTSAEPGQVTNTTVGGTAYLAYQITNSGNDKFTFQLSLQEDATSDWTPEDGKIYLDTNRNAQLDPGERSINEVTLDAEEKAWLVVQISAPDAGSGSLYIAPVASCPTGETDENNFGQVNLVNGPALQAEKSVSPAQARPGDVVRVNLVVRNVGDEDTNDSVNLTDDLADLESMRFEPGSASAPKGSIEYFDGASWTASEPDQVEGIRLVLPGLKVGEEAILSFDLRIDSAAEPGTVLNRAVAEGPGGPAEAVTTIEILQAYELHLGPRGNPRALPGGEGSEDDRQRADLIVDQTYCFEHTLENASNAADDFYLTAYGLPDGVHGTFNITPTVPLTMPVHLEAGESVDFIFCVTANEMVDPFTVDLVARSSTSGSTNHTYDEVEHVFLAGELVLTKKVEPEGTVTAGSELVYTLHFKNDYPIDVTNVVVDDWLDERLEYVSSTPAGTYDATRHRLRWQVDNVSAGEEWEAKVTVRVKNDTPDDTLIENEFTLQADQTPNTLVSNTTKTPVWSTNLLLQKRVTPERVKLGDRLHYVLIVSNPSSSPLEVTVTDTPPAYLEYIPGSATPSEPTVKDGGQLVWGEFTIDPEGMLTFEYDMRVLPGAPEKLINVAIAQGVSTSGAAVASSRATASVRAVEEVFIARKATIVGRVYLDVNRDDHYDEQVDVPLPGARLLLPDGRQVLTDAAGNYSFRSVDAGVWLVVLDSMTAPFEPRPHPEALGDGYSHRVSAWGLTVSDFPLEGPGGIIDAIRKTTLQMGPFKVEKKVIPLGERRYRVVLHLSSAEALPDLTLRDPLPDGGEKEFKFEIFEGDKTITYDLEGEIQLTDPEVRWRYP